MTAALTERLLSVRRRLSGAARRAARDEGELRLVAVTKSAPDALVGELRAAGLADLGESRVQQAERRARSSGGGLRWHLVGHLQSNKARRAVAALDVLHGIDSIDLLRAVEAAAAALGRRPELFLQVNVSGEASKHGFAPAELPEAVAVAASLRHARVSGLMTMAPAAGGPEAARPVFRALAALAREHASPVLPLAELSMGMSEDFEVAVEEGATVVRIGRALVGDGAEAGTEVDG